MWNFTLKIKVLNPEIRINPNDIEPPDTIENLLKGLAEIVWMCRLKSGCAGKSNLHICPNSLFHGMVCSLQISVGKFSRWQFDDIFFLFSYFVLKTGSEISCKTMETICMKFQTLFSRKGKKNMSKCHLQRILPSMLSVKWTMYY